MKALEDKLKEYNLPSLHSKWDLITKEYKWEFFDRLLLQLLDKQMGYLTFIKKIYKQQFVEKDIQLAVRKESFTIGLVRLNENTFLETLRTKLAWGLDKRN